MPEVRKLATILALDAVGYSAAAEQDDSAAAGRLRNLRAAIQEIATPLGGRLFSSAGDGFMLEFSTATAGVQAGLALLEACADTSRSLPQIRIGMHLGEVIVEEDGDLLGHGVNVAARLQQWANPGAMIISEDVRRSLTGELAEQLRPIGVVKLDKMRERIDVFGYGPGQIRRRLRSGSGVWGWIGGGALALVALAMLGASWLDRPSLSAKMAVFPFAAPAADAPAQALAQGISSEILDTMSEIGLESALGAETAVSAKERSTRAKALRAPYALEGDIVRDGQTVRVSARLDDVEANKTVWAQTFERDGAKIEGLRLEVAASAVRVLRCAADARGEMAQLRDAPIAILLRICEGAREAGSPEHLRLARKLVQAAPKSSIAQARLAVESALASGDAPGDLKAQLRQQAADAVKEALRLNPHNGTAYAVRAWGLQETQNLAQAESTLLGFLRLSPDTPELNSLYGMQLRGVGRNKEAVAYMERAFALEPLSPYRAANLGRALLYAGRAEEANALAEKMVGRWPEDEDLAWMQASASFGSPFSEDKTPNAWWDGLTPEWKACWRTAIGGMASSVPAVRQAAAREVRRCMAASPYQSFEVLATLGDIDSAYNASADIRGTVYFSPGLAAFRRDPRFMPLMHRMKLTEYWLQTGHWPDFCTEPGLPYDCKAEAERLERGPQAP